MHEGFLEANSDVMKYSSLLDKDDNLYDCE